MDRFEYVVALMSIITGLGLADFGLSLHRLMKRRRTVRWDWLPLAVAAYMSFALIRLWYQLWMVRDFPGLTSLLFFLTLLVEVFVLFLATAAALPDEDDFRERSIDLRLFYRDQSRYIWVLFTIFAMVWAGHGFFFSVSYGDLELTSVLFFVVPAALGASLTLFGDRRWQTVGVGLLVAQELMWMILLRFAFL